QALALRLEIPRAQQGLARGEGLGRMGLAAGIQGQAGRLDQVQRIGARRAGLRRQRETFPFGKFGQRCGRIGGHETIGHGGVIGIGGIAGHYVMAPCETPRRFPLSKGSTGAFRPGRRIQQRSKMPAAPMPVPTHMVTMPYCRLRRRRAWMVVAERIAPVAPRGWPRAMAPPMGLTTSSFRPRSRITARDCAAKASFSSIQPIWSSVRPAFFRAAGMASLGPMPMMSGGTPRTAKDTKRASGVRLCSFRARSDTTSRAPAPSEVCELLPAVTLPLAAKTGRSR